MTEHSGEDEAIAAVVARLAKETERCELSAVSGGGPCTNPAAAVRWDGAFIDVVCATHADRARERDVTVLPVFRPEKTEEGQ